MGFTATTLVSAEDGLISEQNVENVDLNEVVSDEEDAQDEIGEPRELRKKKHHKKKKGGGKKKGGKKHKKKRHLSEQDVENVDLNEMVSDEEDAQDEIGEPRELRKKKHP